MVSGHTQKDNFVTIPALANVYGYVSIQRCLRGVSPTKNVCSNPCIQLAEGAAVRIARRSHAKHTSVAHSPSRVYWSFCRTAQFLLPQFFTLAPYDRGMRRLRMAPFVSSGGTLLCAAVIFSSPSLCSALMPTSHYNAPAPFRVGFWGKWFGDSYTLSYVRTPILGSLIVILLCQNGTLGIGNPPICVWNFVHLVCGYFRSWVLREGSYFSRRFSARHIRTYQPPPSNLLCSYKPPPFFQALSGILVILTLIFVPFAVWAEQVTWTRSFPQLRTSLPEILSASPVKTAFSLSLTIITSYPAVFGAADGSGDLHEDWSRFGVDGGSRSRPAASTAFINRCSKCVQALVRKESAAHVVGSCSLFLSQKSASNRRCCMPSYYFWKSALFPRTCCRPARCQRLKSQPLLQTKAPPRCTFFAFPAGRLSSDWSVTAGSISSRYPSNLRMLQSAVCVARSSWSATLVPALRPLCIVRQTALNACGGLPVWPLTWGAVYKRDERRLPVAFRTPHKGIVTCSATAESRAHALLEEIKKLTIVEVSELVNLIEQSFGVSVARAAAANPAENSRPQGGETEEEGAAQSKAEKKTAFSVEIKSVPLEKRIVVIKTLRTVRPDLGLKDAKGVIDALPNTILSNVSKEKAEEVQKVLTDAGAQVEIK